MMVVCRHKQNPMVADKDTPRAVQNLQTRTSVVKILVSPKNRSTDRNFQSSGPKKKVPVEELRSYSDIPGIFRPHLNFVQSISVRNYSVRKLFVI